MVSAIIVNINHKIILIAQCGSSLWSYCLVRVFLIVLLLGTGLPYGLLLFSLSILTVYIGWYCGAVVFGLIGCKSLSTRLALPTSFNNNNNNNKNRSFWCFLCSLRWFLTLFNRLLLLLLLLKKVGNARLVESV